MKFGVGQSVKRTEDIRLVTGQGQFTDDFHFENETFAAFLRSPYAHATIKSIDVSASLTAPDFSGSVGWTDSAIAVAEKPTVNPNTAKIKGLLEKIMWPNARLRTFVPIG